MQIFSYFPALYGVVWVALNFGCKTAMPLAMGATLILVCAFVTSRG
jgi:hypothetical protein